MQGWRDQDGRTLCSLLAPETRSKLVQSAGQPCPAAVLGEDLPSARALRRAQAWANGAIVRLDADTLFLARFDTGWKVVAAGCSARPGRPYDCRVEGA